ncbi:hypothetical protein PG989_002080 [Apiospora arundinis]
MPYKVLAPRTTSRSASESTDTTAQNRLRCLPQQKDCSSLLSSLNNHAALWNFLLEIPEENIVQVLHDAQAAPDLESYLAKARGDASTLQGRRPSSDFGTTASLDSPHEN